MQKILIENLELQFKIGVLKKEKTNKQRLIFNISLDVNYGTNINDNYDNVVCYNKIIEKIKKLRNDEHINLLETLVDKVLLICLQNKQVLNAAVKISKPDIYINVDNVSFYKSMKNNS